jgi:4-hydroxy-3-methylbut-2-en-1-yl diphosphate synthase IspG/GcpE
MFRKATLVSSPKRAGALLIAIACCAIPASGEVSAADLTLRIATKPQHDAPRETSAPANVQRESLIEEFLRWQRTQSR